MVCLRGISVGEFSKLPDAIKDLIISCYNDALAPIFPLALLATAVLFFIREKPLASAVEHDVLSESIGEGNILITADDEVVPASR